MLQKLKQHLSRKQSIAHTGIVLNYKKYLKARKGSPRALVSYLTSPVVNDLNNEPEIMFSNRGIARSIPRALNELGYVVDVVNYDNTTAQLPQRYYDLLIQHGAVNYDYVKAALKPGGVLIYFSSGSYWKFHNDSETKRFQNLARRTKSTLSPDRLIELSEEQVNSEANGIIALGNAGVRATYKKFSSVFSLNLACYPDAHFDTFKKDHARSRSNFLFFAGGGNVHKGLDLVVEAFTQLDQHLYIVTHIEDGFRQVYREQLSSPNIHVIGSLQMRTEQYYEVFDACSFSILASCSEGQPGSMIESLNEGLVPIVTKESHLDTAGYGFEITASVDSIKSAVLAASSLPTKEIERRSKVARSKALAEHSPGVFIQNFKEHVAKIVESKHHDED